MELSILYFMGMLLTISIKCYIYVLKIVFTIANSADHDEKLPYAAFHLGLHCLLKYPEWKGLIKPSPAPQNNQTLNEIVQK